MKLPNALHLVITHRILLPALLAISSAFFGLSLAEPITFAEPASNVSNSNRVSISLTVTDERKFVLSGDRKPSFIGMTIGAGGKTVEYLTEDKAPLADHLKRDLLRELRSLGYEEQLSTQSRLITVIIRDWDFDASRDVNFQYRLDISVTSPEGGVLSKSIIKGEKKLGSIINEPKAYADVIRALVRENKDVTSALENNELAIKAEEKRNSEDKYFGIYRGTVQFSDAQVTVSQNPFLCIPLLGGGCQPNSVSQNVHFEKGSTAGFRVGRWGEYWGFAMDLGVTHGVSAWNSNGSSVSFGYDYFSIIPMLRAPYLDTDSVKGGRLNLYGGFGLVYIWGGNIDIYIPSSTRISEKPKGAVGTVALIGVSYRFEKVILFMELRKTDINLESNSWGTTTNVPISAKEMVGGVAYRF